MFRRSANPGVGWCAGFGRGGFGAGGVTLNPYAHADHHGDQAVRVRFTSLPCTVAACLCVRAGSLVSGGTDK
eukprot:349493-Prymnesium_polylepis.2